MSEMHTSALPDDLGGFRVGDIVAMKNNLTGHENYTRIRDMCGQIVGFFMSPLSGGTVAYISWPALNGHGHNCDGLLSDTSGWNLTVNDIEIVQAAEPLDPPEIPLW